MHRSPVTVALAAYCALTTLAVSSARADDTTPPQPFSLPTRHDGYWARDPARPFLATTIDVGYLYLRPRLTLGYGKPFTKWVGIDLNPLVTNEGYGAYGGLRVQIPWFDFRAGARGFSAFTHEYLTPAAHYSSVDLQETTGQASKYVTLEADVSGGIPAGPGTILLVLTASAVELVPAGKYVYEETLRVITNPPAIYRARTGYALRLGPEGAARVGVVGELLDLPGRGDLVFRAGVIASFAIDDHLEALGLLVIPVASPDSIGIAGGDFAELGIRYRWATGAHDAR
jgi:hypothetical protein